MRLLVVAVGVLAAAPPGQAQFRFTPGEPIAVAVEQKTAVVETTVEAGRPAVGMTVTKLNLTKRFEVKAVDAAGAATLELVIAALRQEIRRPGPAGADGKPTIDTVVIDSADPATAAQAAFVGRPVLTLVVTAAGEVTGVTPAAAGADPGRVRAELPFRVSFPAAPAAVWSRPFTVQLDPPLGTGEVYKLTQTYTAKPDAAGKRVVGVATALDAEPKDAAELPPLVPLLWAGEAYFDAGTGRYAGARLGVKREVAGHAGAGSKWSYESTLVETPVPAK